MPQMKVNNQYYTAKQVQEKLGITHGQLYNYVRNDHLHSVIPPGKKLGVYLKEEVDQLAEELNTFFATRTKREASSLEPATEADLPEIVEISRKIFAPNGGSIIPAEVRAKWLKKNPDSFYVLKNEGLIVGYYSILPLAKETIQKLIHDEIEPEALTYDDIKEFTSSKPLQIYIMAIAVDPRTTTEEKRIYGSRLVTGLIKQFIELGKKGVVIESLIARSHKPDGIRLLRKMGFPELSSPVPGKRLFMLKVEESGSPLLTRYKETLKESSYKKPAKRNRKKEITQPESPETSGAKNVALDSAL